MGLVQDVQPFERKNLPQTGTQKLLIKLPLSKPPIARRKLEALSMHTEVEEKNMLPGQSNIQQEKTMIKVIGGI